MRRTVLAALILMTPLPAAAFTARNGMTVTQAGPTEIAVAWSGGRRDTDYWCAAGDFAQRVMNQPVGTRLWRASPKPRAGGEGILFTLDGSRKAPGAGLSQFGAGPRDEAISVGAAVAGHCRVLPPLLLD
ncbi:hypothetical protein [Paracoccus sp. ME4]|uniref:hypothetical protein n=1 Tax=Paracoccus sp. ME4 TaxID=3138066 RepID=UPI00398AAC4E